MADVLSPLTVDFLTWLAPAPRPYAEVMEAWRTSCPQLTIWEDALDAGLVVRSRTEGQAPLVALTRLGRERLAQRAA